MTRALPALVFFLFVLAAPAAAGTVASAKAAAAVMGTVLQVEVVAATSEGADRLAQACIAIARHWDDVLTTWRPEGELERLNLKAGSGPVAISPDLAWALATMEDLARATGAAFDPALGPAVDLWRQHQAPTAAELHTIERAALRGALRLQTALTLEDATGVNGTHPTAALLPGARLDAGGIGKGLALDKIVDFLKSKGVGGAFADFGGSSHIALGRTRAGKAWRVALGGIQPGQLLGAVELHDAALSTSKALGPAAEVGPIIDPFNLSPVPPPRLATAMAPRAAVAEAWSTALVITGRKGLAVARAVGVEAIIYDRDGIAPSANFRLLEINQHRGDH